MQPMQGQAGGSRLSLQVVRKAFQVVRKVSSVLRPE